MSSNQVALEYMGTTAVITFNKPEKLNALSLDDCYKLATLLRQIAQQDKILVTLIIGKGRFFSAGVDAKHQPPPDLGNLDTRRYWLSILSISQIDLTEAFHSHPKVLVTALNGPVIGLSAALVAHSDFIFATPKAYLLTPFASVGLAIEGGASVALVQRMGISKAKEALLFSRKIPAEELEQTGFVNRVLDAGGDDTKFRDMVLGEIQSLIGDYLVGSSMLEIKELLREPGDQVFHAQAMKEYFGTLRKLVEGIPQAEFEKIFSRKKRHKL